MQTNGFRHLIQKEEGQFSCVGVGIGCGTCNELEQFGPSVASTCSCTTASTCAGIVSTTPAAFELAHGGGNSDGTVANDALRFGR